MPLPAFLGTPTDLRLAHPAPGAIGGGAPSNPLRLAMQTQLQTEWCWAAVTASISAFYEDAPPKRQCELATDLLFTPCCIDPLPPPPPPAWSGNAPYALEGALQFINHMKGDLIADAVPFARVVTEIDGGRPICCHITWTSGSNPRSHFNTIVGYDKETQDVIVRDPYLMYGESTLPYETFKSNYHGGTWDETYLTV